MLSTAFIKHYLNINSIIKVINEFEGLKKLLVDSDQKYLFDYYNHSYKNLSQNSKEVQNNEFTDKKEIQLKILETMKNLNSKYYKSHIDKCLIDYFFDYKFN